VPRGKALLRISHLRYGSVEKPIVIQDSARSDRVFELPPIELEETAVITGTVLDSQGKPVAGVRVAVEIVPAFLPLGELPTGIAVTDREGRFRLEGVIPGEIVLEAYRAGVGAKRTEPINIRSAETQDVGLIELEASEALEEPVSAAGVAVTLGENTHDSLEARAGIVIVHVADNSEAERAGLRNGDRLISIAGARVTTMREARALLSGEQGSEVLLEIDRGGERLDLRLRREPTRH
jgi:hypothetical protein